MSGNQSLNSSLNVFGVRLEIEAICKCRSAVLLQLL